ncbi:MAG: cation:proton antiporter [Xanthomonadales bacterium]|nr:cation:proton antiporter [Xanthomonadales bacterium]
MSAGAHALDLGPAVAIVAITVGLVGLTSRLGLGGVLGYLAAGLAVGPIGLRLITDVAFIQKIAEIGVVLLLFVIGLELQPRRLRRMAVDAFGLGGAQLLVSAVLLGAALLATGAGGITMLIAALAMALSSTALALQLLEERREMTKPHGQKAFAILLFQDIAVIPMIVGLSLAGAGTRPSPTWMLFGIVGAVALVVLGHRLLGAYFRSVASIRSRDLFTAGALLAVLAVAYFMEHAGLSMGLGAFLAGVALSETEFRHELEITIDPFKGLLLGLFFLSVGMTIEPGLLASAWMTVLGGALAVVTIKFAVLYAIGTFAGLDRSDRVRLSLLLSQGGEFAFVLFAQASSGNLLDPTTSDILTLVIIASMIMTPLLLRTMDALEKRFPKAEPKLDQPTDQPDHPRVIIAGFGRFGQIVARVLTGQNIAFTALDRDAQHVEFVRRFGNEIYFGDATRPDLLRTAHADAADILVVAIDDVDDSLRLVEVARESFPQLKIIARARNRFHAYRLVCAGVEHIFRETFGSSIEATESVLQNLGYPLDAAVHATRIFRDHDERSLRESAPHQENQEKLIEIAQQGRRELRSLFEQDSRK